MSVVSKAVAPVSSYWPMMEKIIGKISDEGAAPVLNESEVRLGRRVRLGSPYFRPTEAVGRVKCGAK